MPWIEKEGRTVAEARAAAIAAAGLPEAELEIEVIREGAKGLFGLGGEPAVVRVRPASEARDVRGAFRDDVSPAPTPSGHAEAPSQDAAYEASVADAPRAEAATDDEATAVPTAEQAEAAARVASEMVRGVLERMELSGEVKTRVSGGTVYVEVFGDDMGILIGRGGSTLEALQEIIRAGVRRRIKARQAVVVDVESYWERRRTRRRGGPGRDGDDADD